MPKESKVAYDALPDADICCKFCGEFEADYVMTMNYKGATSYAVTCGVCAFALTVYEDFTDVKTQREAAEQMVTGMIHRMRENPGGSGIVDEVERVVRGRFLTFLQTRTGEIQEITNNGVFVIPPEDWKKRVEGWGDKLLEMTGHDDL